MAGDKFDKSAGDNIAAAIREIEKQTDAEMVVVVRGRSGNYLHADYLFGAIVALIGLVFVLFSPIEFHTYWIPFDVVVLFIAGAWISSRGDWIRRTFTTRKFRANAARMGASAMFYEAGIANTAAETGMLVYLSLLERRLEVIADRGILKAVPPLEWNQCVFELHQVGKQATPQRFIDGLLMTGKLLAEHLPATGENPNELADGPRIELK
jgi:putative membrane protein